MGQMGWLIVGGMAGLFASSGRKSSALLALSLGVGAAAALLVAPRAGHKRREVLKHSLEQGVSKVREMVDPNQSEHRN